jgi:hypothetical protein
MKINDLYEAKKVSNMKYFLSEYDMHNFIKRILKKNFPSRDLFFYDDYSVIINNVRPSLLIKIVKETPYSAKDSREINLVRFGITYDNEWHMSTPHIAEPYLFTKEDSLILVEREIVKRIKFSLFLIDKFFEIANKSYTTIKEEQGLEISRVLFSNIDIGVFNIHVLRKQLTFIINYLNNKPVFMLIDFSGQKNNIPITTNTEDIIDEIVERVRNEIN